MWGSLQIARGSPNLQQQLPVVGTATSLILHFEKVGIVLVHSVRKHIQPGRILDGGERMNFIWINDEYHMGLRPKVVPFIEDYVPDFDLNFTTQDVEQLLGETMIVIPPFDTRPCVHKIDFPPSIFIDDAQKSATCILVNAVFLQKFHAFPYR
jgi:hypothetical protein